MSVSFSLNHGADIARLQLRHRIEGLSLRIETCASRSAALLLMFIMLASFLIEPVMTRKKLMRPAKGIGGGLKDERRGP